MSTFVLLHGADNTGRLWDNTAPLLREQGHSVFCPTVSPVETNSLRTNIGEACSVLEGAALADVTLVGHGYGGFVATGVADRIPQSLLRLVYLDSALPQNGKSYFEVLTEVYGLKPDDYGIEAHQALMEPLEFSESRLKQVPKTYIQCRQSAFADVTRQALQSVIDAPEDSDWGYYELDGSHKCMVDQPQELADLLLKLK